MSLTKNRYKAFVGRVFILREFKFVPGSLDKQARNRKLYTKQDTFNSICFVCDETNSRVKITTKLGHPLWIPKFFLLREIVDEAYKAQDYLHDLIQELIDIKEYIKEQQETDKPITLSVTTKQNMVETLEKSSNILRQILDNKKKQKR